MKFVIVLAALFALAVARPEVTNLRFDSDVRADGYNFAYENSDGTTHEESGSLKNVGTDDEAIVVKGSFKFIADDGKEYAVSYVADDGGFQPQGAHLPVAA